MGEKRKRRRAWPWIGLLLTGAVLVYMPLSGLGALVWEWVYTPVLDAVDAGAPWAMTLLAAFVVVFMVCGWETRR